MAPELDEGKEPESTIVLETIAEVFGVDRWNDKTRTGLIDWELVALLSQLDEFLEGLKKNINHGPTSLPPMESESSSSPGRPDDPTSYSSGSGSVPIEPSVA